MIRLLFTISLIFLTWMNAIGQTQYDYYGYRGVYGGVDRALNGMIIMAIIVVVAVILLFAAAGIMKIYYALNPSADPDIRRQNQLEKQEKEQKAVIEEKRAKAVPEAIDLGLSVKWASFNLGAYCITDIGMLITWGNNSSENPERITDVNEVGEYTGNEKYDAAAYKLGNGWRVPTERECEELITKCNWEYCEKDGIKGHLVVGPTGNSIFLPFNKGDKTNGPYTFAAYWTSSPTYSEYGEGHNAKDLRIATKSKPAISIWSHAIATSCHFGIRPVWGIIPNKREMVIVENEDFLDTKDCSNEDTCLHELARLSKIQTYDEDFPGHYSKETTIVDKYRVVYSKDGKRLIDAGNCSTKEYHVKEGTEIICDNAFIYKGIDNGFLDLSRSDSDCRVIEIPPTVRFIGFNALKCNCKYINRSPFYQIQGPLLIDLRKRSVLKCLDTHIKRLIIGEGIISIEAQAFYNCREVKEVLLPSSLKAINESAFMGCVKLEHLNLPQWLNIIKDSAFYGCSSLNEINFEENIALSVIERCAFYRCEALAIMSLPCNILKIGEKAFCGCKSISAILPRSLMEIGDAPFPPSNINIMSDSIRYKILDGLLIDTNRNDLIQIADSTITNVEIPYGVYSISNYAFANSVVERVSIKNPNIQLGDGVFWGCKELRDVKLPTNLKEIPPNTFAFCDSLESITLPRNIERLCVKSFYGCKKLTCVVFGNKVKWIENAVFEWCQNLVAIEIPFSVEFIANAFERSGVKILNYNARNAEIHFSIKGLSQINVGEMVEVLPSGLFAGANIKQIIIPDNVRRIMKDCFTNVVADELYINSTNIIFDHNWISKFPFVKNIYVRAEIYKEHSAYMPKGAKIKKIYPHKFLFFRWI